MLDRVEAALRAAPCAAVEPVLLKVQASDGHIGGAGFVRTTVHFLVSRTFVDDYVRHYETLPERPPLSIAGAQVKVEGCLQPKGPNLVLGMHARSDSICVGAALDSLVRFPDRCNIARIEGDGPAACFLQLRIDEDIQGTGDIQVPVGSLVGLFDENPSVTHAHLSMSASVSYRLTVHAERPGVDLVSNASYVQEGSVGATSASMPRSQESDDAPK